jgi:hypothetical protein
LLPPLTSWGGTPRPPTACPAERVIAGGAIRDRSGGVKLRRGGDGSPGLTGQTTTLRRYRVLVSTLGALAADYACVIADTA